MSVAEMLTLSGRDRAVLRAIAQGRCTLGTGWQPVLLVDGLACTDPTVGRKLVSAGLIQALAGPARLTAAGRLALAG